MDDIIELKKKLDGGDMAGLISAMPAHLLDGMRIAKEADLGGLETEAFHALILAGMGGSAIGGDIARSYLSREIPIPFVVQRHYRLPGYVNKRSLVICSSYSGNTEETVSAYREAEARGANILVITSGGELAQRAAADNIPSLIVPGGIPAPRAALGYSIAPLLTILFRLGLCLEPYEEIQEASLMMKQRLPTYATAGESNRALELAKYLHGTMPLIYAAQDHLDAVAVRFKGQICENAECLAFANFFPEFNHNELVGWGKLHGLEDKLSAVVISDEDDHSRIRARMRIVAESLEQEGRRVVRIQAERVAEFAKMMLLIQLADFTSYYLALLNGVDPTPVKAIDYLKEKLSKIK